MLLIIIPDDLSDEIDLVDSPISSVFSSPLKVLYTNADQFFNRRDDLLMLITGNKPELILINEVLPKVHSTCMSSCRVDIPDYFHLSNFDHDHIEQPTGLRGICIYVSNKLVPTKCRSYSLLKMSR